MYKIFFLLVTLALTSSVAAVENKFSGTWKLMSGEYLNHENKLVQYKDLELSSIKVISATHFSFVSMSGNKFWSSGVGLYRFTESNYIESPIYTSYGVSTGKEYTFLYTIDEGIWTNTRWKNEIRVEYEVWQKIE
jgi:hypothetical protein